MANCNSLAVSRFEFVSKDFRAFNQQMADMKKDLDYVHRSLRIIKHKLANKHPVEYGQAKKEHTLVIPDDEEDDHRPQTTEKTVEQSDLEQSNAKSTNEQNTEPNSN